MITTELLAARRSMFAFNVKVNVLMDPAIGVEWPTFLAMKEGTKIAVVSFGGNTTSGLVAVKFTLGKS